MRFSHSSKEMYETCPYKWKLHYQNKYRSVRVGSALAFGNSFDLALNELLTSRDILKASEVFQADWGQWKHKPIINYYKSDFDRELCSPWELDEIDLPQFSDVSEHLLGYYTLLNKGLRMLTAYEAEILPKIKNVISVQREFDIPIPGTEDTVCGKLDLIAEMDDGNTYILDNKTTSTPYPKHSPSTKPQTALYSLGLPEYNNNTGFLTVNKKSFATQVLLGQAPEELKEEVINQFTELSEKIKSEKFSKNKKGCFSFGQRCQFYSHCHGEGFSEDIYEEVKDEL